MSETLTGSTSRPAPKGRRPRPTSPRVRIADRAATVVVTLGGLCVILAVLGILVYLVAVVAPLFSGADLTRRASYDLPPAGPGQHLLFAELDEYRAMGLALHSTGELIAFAADDGRILERRPLFPEATAITSFCRAPAEGAVAIGFADGSIRTGRIDFETTFDGGSKSPTPAGGVTQSLPDGSSRHVKVRVEMDEPIPAPAGSAPVAVIDYRVSDRSSHMAIIRSDGAITVSEVTRRKNLLTGKTESDVDSYAIPAPDTAGRTPVPAFALLAGAGDQLYLAWPDGSTLRYDLRDTSHPVLAETTDLTPGGDARLTAMRFMTGEQSIVTGDSEGRTLAWFRVPREASGGDGFALVPAHRMSPGTGAVSVLAASRRDRTVVTATDSGEVLLHHLTSERRLAREQVQPAGRVVAAQVTPKSDALFVVTEQGRARWWDLRNPHPQASLGALFGKVWYEGYPAPTWTWQSSSGTDDFEPKLSLVPLLFGTLKATLYSMIFAVPIAFCAALYTSEFLDRRYRGIVKPTIEMMASLPSVVLGFVAALVLAPLVETWVLAVLAAFALVPLSALTLGHVWPILPARWTRFAEGRAQPLLILAVVGASLAGARALARPLEWMLFDGDFKSWLDGRTGTGAPGLAVLVWPVIVAVLLAARRRLPGGRSRGTALGELLRFLTLLALSVVLAWAVAGAGSAMGMDPRGSVVGTYAQRNALVVGFVMGFAVIPIIYTIAEDALASVPQALRSASLGCGATRWQTAIRVVLPVALPGLFSAMMIGLGRAVGETMIVLMAAGNTPVMDFNIFSGLRTLSANIAVELPEAARGGSLYRTLFLAALLLFLLTFVLNTLAEIIRQRFRWKALS